MIESLKFFDTELLLAINGCHNVFFDWVMVFASAKFSWMPLYLILLYFLIREYRWKTLLVLAFVAVMILISDQLSVHAFKNAFMRLRPCHNPEITDRIRLVTACGGLYGFVSSHAVNSFALTFFVIGVLKTQQKWLPFIMFWYAFLIIYSRVYLGVHYPGDVIIGALVGIIIGQLIFILFRYVNQNLVPDKKEV